MPNIILQGLREVAELILQGFGGTVAPTTFPASDIVCGMWSDGMTYGMWDDGMTYGMMTE